MRLNIATQNKGDFRIQLFSILAVCLILCWGIYTYAFEGGKPTCSNYILNSYLYVILALILIILVVLSIDQNKGLSKMVMGLFTNIMMYIVFIIVFIGLLFAIRLVPSEKQGLKHALWLAMVLCIGITLYPAYMYGSMLNIMMPTLYATLAIIVLVTMAAFYKPDLLPLKFYPYVRYALFGLIVLYLIAAFFMSYEQSEQFSYYLAALGLVIFTLLLFYNTHFLYLNSKRCQDSGNVAYNSKEYKDMKNTLDFKSNNPMAGRQKIKPDYINESTTLIMNIVNIFLDVLRLMGGRRKR